MRFVATFLIGQADHRFWWQEVAQSGASDMVVSDGNILVDLHKMTEGGASDMVVSDGNIPNENKHPKQFISMNIAAKSYSPVKNSQKSNFSASIIFPAHPIELI